MLWLTECGGRRLARSPHGTRALRVLAREVAKECSSQLPDRGAVRSRAYALAMAYHQSQAHPLSHQAAQAAQTCCGNTLTVFSRLSHRSRVACRTRAVLSRQCSSSLHQSGRHGGGTMRSVHRGRRMWTAPFGTPAARFTCLQDHHIFYREAFSFAFNAAHVLLFCAHRACCARTYPLCGLL